jgi:hypothetical protein
MQTVAEALKQFSKQPGCEQYRTDSAKISLLTTYLWQRQLSDDLTFERFLEKFAPLADHDEKNRKHPADALYYHCPRSSSVAKKAGKRQWSAEECSDFLVLYVDMVREAESQGLEPPLTCDQFLEQLGPAYLAGELAGEAAAPVASGADVVPVAAPVPAPASTGAVAPVAGATVVPVAAGVADTPAAPILAIGQRCIYTTPQRRQIRGTCTGLTEYEGKLYADFRSDEGEDMKDLNRTHLTAVSEADHPRRTVDERTVAGRALLRISKADMAQVQQALALTQAMGNVPIGGMIRPFAVVYPDGKYAAVSVVNGETGPYVDAQLLSAGATTEVLADVPPRKNITGEYIFQVDGQTYLLEVTCRE